MQFFRESKNARRYVLGYDLGEDVSQISFLASDSDLPETLSTLAGAEAYNIPTVLCKRKDVNQWFYGKEAVAKIEAEEGIRVDGLIERARTGKRVNIDGTGYDPVSLLTLFVKRTLSLLSMELSMDMVDAIAFTTRTMDSRMIEVLSEVTGALSLPIKNIFYQSYEDSLYHYMLYQPDELLSHAVIACDYSFGDMTVYDMKLNHRTRPVVVTIDKKTYGGMVLSQGKFSENSKERAEQVSRLDERFLEFSEKTMEGRIVSSVFLLGDGFRDQWMQKSLEFLCRTRRVFQGNNLFSKGASIAAREKVGPSERMSRYVLLDGGKLKANLGLMVKKQGKEVYHALLDAGENWYDVSCGFDLILEDENQVDVIITPLTGGERYVHTIELKDLPERPPRTTRLRLKAAMRAADKVNVHIEDMGFGELFENSGLSWDEEISV